MAAFTSAESLTEDSLRDYCRLKDDEVSSHLNIILVHAQRTKKLEEIVGILGPQLTNDNETVRSKAHTLLGEILTRLPRLPLNDAAIVHYTRFFISRLSDFPSVPGSLLALRSLLQHHTTSAEQAAGSIARAIFRDLHVPAMTQILRQRAFEVLFECIGTSHETALQSILDLGAEFLKGFLDCMEGEKDPRCLILCLKILAKAQATFPVAADENAEAIFDLTVCYFPITFTPPPNDPHRITPEMLSAALRVNLTARPSMAQYVLPLLVDKLSSTHVPAKLEALITLQAATRSFGLKAIQPNLPHVVAALLQEVSNCPETTVVNAALETARTFATWLCRSVQPSDDQTLVETSWSIFAHGCIDKSIQEIQSSPGSMISRACARLLGGIARATDEACTAVLRGAIPVALGLIEKKALDLADIDLDEKEAALELLADLIDAVDPDMDYSNTTRGSPISPYISRIRPALLACLSQPSPLPILASKGLASLGICFPHIEGQGGAGSILYLTQRLQLMHDTQAYDTELAQALLQGLETMSNRRPELRSLLLQQTLPEIIRWLDTSQQEGGAPLDRSLAALEQLASQAEVFRHIVTALLARVLVKERVGSDMNYRLYGGTRQTQILAAIARIFAHLSSNAQQEVPQLFKILVSEEAGNEVEGGVPMLTTGHAQEADQTVEKPDLGDLYLVLVQTASQGHIVEAEALKACKQIFYSATQMLTIPLQDRLVSRVLHVLGVSSAADDERDQPSPENIGLLRPEQYPVHYQALTVSLTILAAINVKCIFCQTSSAVGLLPALLHLARHAPPNSPVEPATYAPAILVNKLPLPEKWPTSVSTFFSSVRATLVSAATCIPQLERQVETLAWFMKALILRCEPTQLMQDAVKLLLGIISIDIKDKEDNETANEPSTEQIRLALHSADAMGTVLREGPMQVLPARPELMHVNPIWLQRFFYLAFPQLQKAIEKHRHRPHVKAAALIAVCSIVAGLPRSLIQSELAKILIVVLQGMQSTHESLRSVATETFARIAKDSIEAVVPHLSTILPVLHHVCTPSHPLYLPKARLRVLALQSLLELTQLPYAKLHPFKTQIAQGLMVSLDDRKKAVRQMAVKVRNAWMVMGSRQG